MTSSKARRQRKRAARGSDVPARAAAPPALDPPNPPKESGRARLALVVLACAYLATVWLEGVGSNVPAALTPRPWLYFGQVAALFKDAGMMAIQYRAEGWSCADRRWIEVDVRPWFQIDADTKESRFHRALQFYRRERKVMQALEAYVLRRNNESTSRPKIGGVRFSSLRVPYPNRGDRVTRFEHKPLSAYPEDQRHAWYWTPKSRRRDACGDPSKIDDPDDSKDVIEPKEPRTKEPE